jgi:hypothetical protein
VFKLAGDGRFVPQVRKSTNVSTASRIPLGFEGAGAGIPRSVRTSGRNSPARNFARLAWQCEHVEQAISELASLGHPSGETEPLEFLRTRLHDIPYRSLPIRTSHDRDEIWEWEIQ